MSPLLLEKLSKDRAPVTLEAARCVKSFSLVQKAPVGVLGKTPPQLPEGLQVRGGGASEDDLITRSQA